jgi:hypothetical protein
VLFDAFHPPIDAVEPARQGRFETVEIDEQDLPF